MLRRALKSVFAQTEDGIEIIVVDDASTEDLGDIARELESRGGVWLRHDVNRGPSPARNTGLRAARGEFAAFLDSDDAWLPDKLARQLAAFADGPPDLGLVYTGIRVIGPMAQPEPPHLRGRVFVDLLQGNVVGPASTPLIRRSLVADVGGFDETLPSCQDWDLWLRLARRCAFDFIPAPLVLYHVEADSITADRGRSVRGHRRLAEKYRDDVRRLAPPARARHHFYLGRVFWWKKARGLALRHLALCLANDLGMLAEVWHFVIGRHLSRLRWRRPAASPGSNGPPPDPPGQGGRAPRP